MAASTKMKTPREATEFEREQMRALLASGDLSSTLIDMNLSVAWLPFLIENRLIQESAQLVPWLERNFSDAEAVRDVAANVHFFTPETARLLEFALNRQAGFLPPLLLKCWRLILRAMRNGSRTLLRNDWFDIAPRVRRGDLDPELIQRLVDVLTPKLRVGKRLRWREEERERVPVWPTDLLSIEYEIDEAVSADDVLSAWPATLPAESDSSLLHSLTYRLGVTLEDAVDVGVESNTGYSISDTDVPSVAEHQQNAYRSGFLPIVRVSAETWTRLAAKNSERAISFVLGWASSGYRLIRRLSMYAAANEAVPAEAASRLLLDLPQGELFFTNSTVEVHRLLRTRSRDFSADTLDAIQNKIVQGPPQEWFREGTDVGTNVDRVRFDVLGDLERIGVHLNIPARKALEEIRERHPVWELRPPEQAGFHIWHESSYAIVGDAGKLEDIPDDGLVSAAKAAAENAEFMAGDAWQALCQADPGRALRGLVAEARRESWPSWAWNPFLWAAAQKLEGTDKTAETASILLRSPEPSFKQVVEAAAYWLDEKAKELRDELLWPLWDRIEDSIPRDQPIGRMRDALTDSLNSPAGRLTEVLLKKFAKGPNGEEITNEVRERCDKLLSAGDNVGFLSRIRAAAEVSFLFERAPLWTAERIIPVFEWTSEDAPDAWSARKYANYIGSPELFRRTKRPFLELFGRKEVAAEDQRVFADWLAAITVANQKHQAGYPISKPEARAALRRVDASALGSVAHRLALEMESAKPEEKETVWRDVVAPVFTGIWPLDAELQAPANTFKLVQILRATGTTFSEAADTIIPFIRAEDPRRHTSVFSVAEADEALYASSPEKMLELLAAVVGDAPVRSVFELNKALERIRQLAPGLADSKRFQNLLAQASVG